MPRANRHFFAGHIWHITHRCHQRKFLLKFARDRRRYLHWVFEAKKRFGLSVLNYMVTSNHIHLLVHKQASCIKRQATVKKNSFNRFSPSKPLMAFKTWPLFNGRDRSWGIALFLI